MYLCTFRTSRSKISTYGSPLCPLSNATSMTPIGFSNEELCQIFHSDLIIDLFRRANLYEVPRVTIWTSGSEKYLEETTVRPLSVPFCEISIRCSERKL